MKTWFKRSGIVTYLLQNGFFVNNIIYAKMFKIQKSSVEAKFLK
jgi:hypothetical protein